MVDDQNRWELVTKVRALVLARFSGNYKTAFDYYGRVRARSGTINIPELQDLLKDAGVGNFQNRGAWATSVLHMLDKNKDGFISFIEFQMLVVTRDDTSALPRD